MNLYGSALSIQADLERTDKITQTLSVFESRIYESYTHPKSSHCVITCNTYISLSGATILILTKHISVFAFNYCLYDSIGVCSACDTH